MAAEKVQLSLSSQKADDNRRVIAQELADARKNTGLPKLTKAANNAMLAAKAKMEGMMDGSGRELLPRVGASVQDKMQSARRGAALASALGTAGLEKQLAKEEMEKKKRMARLKSLGRHSSQQAGGGKDGGNKGHHEQESARASARQQPAGPAASSAGGPAQLPSAVSRQRSTRSGGAPSSRRATTTGSTGPASQHPPAAAMSRASTFRSSTAALSRASTHRRGAHAIGAHHGHSSLRRRFLGVSLLLDRKAVHGVRPDSRVGQLLAEFGGKDDWVSVTVLRHRMAAIIQANVRGFLLRLRWWSDPEEVVDALHAKIQADATEAERRARLRRQLEIRSITAKQKKMAVNTVAKLFGARALQSAAPGGSNNGAAAAQPGLRVGVARWGKLQKNTDILVQDVQSEKAKRDAALELGHDPSLLDGSQSGSDFSDLEMEDLTAVRLRARTPPWQKQEESQWAGQLSKLTRNKAQSKLEMRWDLDASADRLDGARQRRRERNQEQAEEELQTEAFDPVTQSLPPDVVAKLLLPTYLKRMTRLGLMDPEEAQAELDEAYGEKAANPAPDSATVVVAPPPPAPPPA